MRAEGMRAEGMRAEGMRAEGMRAEAVRAEWERAEASRAAQESAGQTRGMQVQPATTVGSPDRPVAGSRECTALFVTRLRELGVEVEVVASLGAARRALERLVGERGWGSVACAPGLKWEGIAKRWTVEARDASFGLCEADWAVAETGSVVVCSSAEVRRGYSLVPPAVGFFVTERRIVPSVGDVLRELPTDGHALPSCVSFVSGPSSTSDLAAVHVVGVHGPGEVFVWVIERADDRDDATGT
jgi:L-lactate dehydrogenase complex protein LldG